jgi:hypothetical protein
MRKDYIANTIDKVKKNHRLDESDQVLDRIINKAETENCESACENLDEDSRAKGLKAVSTYWNVNILKFEIYPSEDTNYVLYIDNGIKILFKNNSILTTQRTFRERISNFTHRIVPSYSPKVFERNIDALLKIGVIVPVEEDATREDLIKGLIRDYINSHARLTYEEAIEMRRPFFDTTDNHWYVFTAHMVDWLDRNRKFKTSKKALGIDLKFVGAEQVIKIIRADDGTPRKLRPKKIPRSIVI